MSSSESNQRLFFALWPGADLQTLLAEKAREALGGRRARRTPAENLHVTLAFLGEVSPEARTCAEQAAGRISGAPFTLSIDRLGYWSRKGLLWAGSSTPPPALERLAADLGGALEADCGFQRDQRPFQAHVTVARKVPRMPGRIAIEPLEWPVERFVLVASELGPNGATYTVVMAHARALFPARLVGRGVTLLNLFVMGGVGVAQWLTGEVVQISRDAAGPTEAYQLLFALYAGLMAAALAVYLFSRDARP